MTWSPLPRGDATDGVSLTVAAKQVTLTVGYRAIVALGWDLPQTLPADEAQVRRFATSLGDDDHAGWLRVDLFEDGEPADTSADEALTFNFSPATLPGLAKTKPVPLVWRVSEGGLEVQLPLAQAKPRRARATAPVASLEAKRAAPAALPPANALTPIATPTEHRDLVKSAFAVGLEVVFLSNGKVYVNGKQMSVPEMEDKVRRAA